MSSAPTALIYAELLSNIRQVSVIASLQTLSKQDTRATLSDDKQLLKLIHNDTAVLLRLPAQVAALSDLKLPPLGSREISWRLALSSTASSNTGSDAGDGASAPWPANKLSEQTQASCRKCANTLIAAGSIQIWKDLPSENWAEMMDFWHCHKPNVSKRNSVGSHHDGHLEGKGYGANAQFIARRGVGFVDLTYFLFSREDCLGFKLDKAQDKLSNGAASREPIYCEQCSSIIGAFDELANGFRIDKWSLSLAPTSSQRATYPESYFLTAHLLSLISSQSINKFILHSTSSNQASLPILHIWVFAPRLIISLSTTGPNTSKSKPVSKIFYRSISDEECSAMLENASMSVEEVQLPAEVMTRLAEALRLSTMSIPESARRFREWEVGFLERFVEDMEE